MPTHMTNGLKREDFSTPTWRRLSEYFGARLSELREQNDRQSDIETTSATRGSIAEVKRILALADEASAGGGITPGELTGDDRRDVLGD
jgi:hypothetical protein